MILDELSPPSSPTTPEPEIVHFVKESVEVVKDVVIEEANIVAEVVAEGVEVAVETASTVGEIPSVNSTHLEAPDRDTAIKTVAFWVSFNECHNP